MTSHPDFDLALYEYGKFLPWQTPARFSQVVGSLEGFAGKEVPRKINKIVILFKKLINKYNIF